MTGGILERLRRFRDGLRAEAMERYSSAHQLVNETDMRYHEKQRELHNLRTLAYLNVVDLLDREFPELKVKDPSHLGAEGRG